MRARTLFEAGRLDQAVEALSLELRTDPTDLRRRTFLFELLCFAGEYDRAEKHLDVLARGDGDTQRGAWLYRGALHAARARRDMFGADTLPGASAEPPAPVAGRLNGEPFESLSDADPRIGARFEVFLADRYTWIPLQHIAAVRLSAPQRLRDLLWAPAHVRAGPSFQGAELRQVLLPAMTPLSCQHGEEAVRLGRCTVWQELGEVAVPVGQKLLLVDGEPFPILELRELEITPGSGE